MITDSNLSEFLNSNWGDVCNIAYRNYLKLGRGLIGLKMAVNEKGHREAKMVYGVFTDNSVVSDEVLDMIASYTPEDEFLIQYQSETGTVKTVCIKSGSNKTPKEIWVEMGSQIDNT